MLNIRKPKRYKELKDFTEAIGLDRTRSLQAEIKAQLTGALIKEIQRKNLTHGEVAEMSGVARSTVTGIVNGSLQSVSIDRILRVLTGLDMSIEVKVKKSA